MAISVMVSSSFLEDILRLLDFLDERSERDELHFYKSGYSLRIEYDNALWELRLKIKQLQEHIVETYLLTVDNITEAEKRELLEWVAVGNSVYDNPYSLYDDSGRPMDFINGCRTGVKMTEDFFGVEPEVIDYDDWDDETPF